MHLEVQQQITEDATPILAIQKHKFFLKGKN